MAVQASAGSSYLYRASNVPADSGATIAGWFIFTDAAGGFGGFRILFSLDVSGDDNAMLFYPDDRLGIYAPGTGDVYFTNAPAVGVPFFAAMTWSGTTNVGYWRYAGDRTFQTLSTSYSTTARTAVSIGSSNAFPAANFGGPMWNVKVWDRALTETELLIESFYARPMFPTSLNFWWPLYNVNDTADRSGNGRNPTVGGTLTTADGPVNLWVPKRKLFLPAAASGTTYTITPSGGISFAGAPTITRRNQIPVSGGVTFGGTSVLIRRNTVPVSGGVSFAGTAPITFVNGSVTYTITPSGGITFAGTIEQDHTRAYAISGGIAFSGTVSTQITKQITPTGGITLSGNVSFIRENVWAVSGGVSFGGSAPITFNGNTPAVVSTRLPLTSMGQ